ncbi:hypothetical protein M408DRAFT_11008 [Serendipita vermifera MAFF 305830]|uniref:Uncharacterized protein n=1 Tax=Serendipita vermifera MAFF 305830 TaxID=933852 RepID=A0A0C3AWP5_SERVB|nr:hypothetical protein M408DRAFT_11008 [Serendipita vermifera MAFF 305830]
MVVRLPPEIWAIIMTMAAANSICAYEKCAYSNFKDLQRILAWDSHDATWNTLRLVSHTFKVLAGRFPHRTLWAHMESIPNNIVSIQLDSSHPSIRRLLDGTMDNCEQLVALVIDYHDIVLRRSGSTALFRGICSFPNLHKLTLSDLAPINGTLIWSCLNAACPSLTFLHLSSRYPQETQGEAVIFERLEILVVRSRFSASGLEFPSLRHAILEELSLNNILQVTQSRKLESFYLENLSDTVQFDWKLVPNLCLLGIPYSHLSIINSCPKGHPVSKLHISRVRYRGEVRSIGNLATETPIPQGWLSLFRSQIKIIPDDEDRYCVGNFSDIRQEIGIKLDPPKRQVQKGIGYIWSFVPFRNQISSVIEYAELTKMIVFSVFALIFGILFLNWRSR